MTEKYKLYFSGLAILIISLLAGCGDDVPTDYVASNFVEALLIVGEPVSSIRIMKSQPVYHTLNYYKSLIKDADVTLRGDGLEMKLTFNFDTINPSYVYNNDYKIKPSTEYALEIKLSDGTLITGTTTTPGSTEWIRKPKSILNYPKDSIKLAPGDTMSWKRVTGFDYSIIGVVCLDTLEYGKYLATPTAEKNRRVYKPFARNTAYLERSTTFLIPNVQTSVVWTAFKWFGKHEVVVYVPDWNYTRWALQNLSSGSINPLLTSIKGADGVFGSASVVRDTIFLMKNIP